MAKSNTSKRTIVEAPKTSVKDLQAQLDALMAENATLKANQGSGRAEQAIEIIKANPIFTTKSLAVAMAIESKNASSVLNALKKRQYRWVKDGDNFVFIGKMNDASWKEYVVSLVPQVEVAKSA